MKPFRAVPTHEQLAMYLHKKILNREITGTMPGVKQLVKNLGVNSRAISDALSILQKEGVLASQGPRRQRLIVPPNELPTPSIKIKLLLFEPYDKKVDYLLDLQFKLRQIGFTVSVATKTLRDFGDSVNKLARYVKQNPTDAWIVVSASKPALKWFADQPFPTFAIFGRMQNLPIAGARIDKKSALIKAINKLYESGHRRMVMLCHEDRRKPFPGAYERTFLDQLNTLGIKTSAYNLPDWPQNSDGFHNMLSSVFAVTPPTAILTDTSPIYIGTMQFLQSRKLSVPNDVSLICGDPDPSFDLCKPQISHFSWSPTPVMRNVIKWAHKISLKDNYLRQKVVTAKFIEGETITNQVRTF